MQVQSCSKSRMHFRIFRCLSLVTSLVTAVPAMADNGEVSGTREGSLEQVILLSRHNLRAPVVASGALPLRSAGQAGTWAQASSPPKAACWRSIWAVTWASGCVRRSCCRLRVARSWLTSTPMPTAFSAPRPPRSSSLPVPSRLSCRGRAAHGAGHDGSVVQSGDPQQNTVFRERAMSAMQRALAASELAPALSVVEQITRYPQSACAGAQRVPSDAGRHDLQCGTGQEPRASGSLAPAGWSMPC